MRILLTNDDGIFSPGLAAMARVLRKLGEVTIAAPASEQSGVGQGITFLNPLTINDVYREGAFWGWAVQGTPVDCVKIGAAKLCPERPDLVVSGMNNGLNAGANIHYSGTVAAALEGAFLGIPSFAVSLQYSEKQDDARTERAAELALEIIKSLLAEPRPGIVMNINIPFSVLKESPENRKIAFVPADRTPYWDAYDERRDPTGRRYYWLAGRPDYKRITEGATDFGAVTHGAVAVTPLTFDQTCRDTLAALRQTPVSCNIPDEPAASEAPNFRMFRQVD